MYNCRQEKQIIMKENTVFVNREKMLIRKQSSEESNEPLLSQGVEEKVATCTTTYNTLVSCSSSNNNSNSNSSGGDTMAPITGVHSLFNTPGFSNNNQYQLPAAPAPLPVVAQPQSAITNMTAPAIEDFS